jgi:hypothetical protein
VGAVTYFVHVDDCGGGGHRIDLVSGYQCQSPVGEGALGGDG